MKEGMVIFLGLLIVSRLAFAAENGNKIVNLNTVDKIEQKVFPLVDGTSVRVSFKNKMIVLIEHLAADSSLINGDKESYANGKIKIVDSYENGILRVRKAYFENGELWYSLRMTKEGTQPEMVMEYTSDGKLKEGAYKENYPSGRLKSIGYYQKGVPDGKFQFFCANGKLAVEREFKSGVLLVVDKNYEDGELHCKDDPFSYFDVGFYSLPEQLKR